ncbi:uncharacterized protein PSFLO_07786 [Pseudozyma flocculosa]|uniref:Uncharacterized protein n=1 Tax=Pseudozyma flocculosa TaxID=84751 RepID=A0A5C3FCZ4_9BASI|nr:uncharacterized protein PSFLO_07786 [Pseudozyma flocculosa]
MSSRYSRPTDELVALGPHVYDPSTMTKVDKECILVDCCDFDGLALVPFGAAARRDLYETPGDWVLCASAAAQLKYGTAPPAFHLDHGFLDLKQQLALKLSVLREEWWERASVALDEALLACDYRAGGDRRAGVERSRHRRWSVVAADDGAQPAAWGSGVEESAPSDAPGLDFLSSKNRVVAGHTMAEVIAYAHARPVTTLLAEVRLDCLSPWILEAKIFLSRVQLHVGRRWNELPQHRRERPVPCDNCVRLGINKKPVLSCTGCYERRKGCVAASVLPSGCASWEQRDCWGERPLDQLTGEQRTLALRNHTAGAAAVRESDGSGVPMPFALDLLAAYYAQGRVEDAILRLADGLPRGQLPVRLPQGMAQDICVSVAEEVDDDEDDLYLEE